MKTIVRLCLVGLLAGGMSSVSSAARPLASYYEQQAAGAASYRLPPQAILPELERTLSEAGYSWAAGATSGPMWQTDWRCSGEACEKLTVTFQQTNGGTGVAIDRIRREGATDSAIEWQAPAGDLEWSLLKRLNPAEARRIAAQAQKM